MRSGSTSSKIAWYFVAETLGARRRPSPWSTRHWMTVRRSCQPMAGPRTSPVFRSHTMDDARWLAMPTAATEPAISRTARAVSSAAVAIPRASISTRPGAGLVGRTVTWWVLVTVPSGWTSDERTDEVPTSTTRTEELTSDLRRTPASRGCRCRGDRGHPSRAQGHRGLRPWRPRAHSLGGGRCRGGG